MNRSRTLDFACDGGQSDAKQKKLQTILSNKTRKRNQEVVLIEEMFRHFQRPGPFSPS